MFFRSWWIETVSLLLVLSYHGKLFYDLKHSPLCTTYGVNNHMRRSWVEEIRRSGQKIVAVQTLRNWTMAASFLASTAMLVALGILNIFFSENLSGIVLKLVGENMHSTVLPEIKLTVLVIVFLFSFACFAFAIRYYNHVALMMSVPSGKNEFITEESVFRRLRLGTGHYTLGMRSLYISLPLAVWLLNPVYLLPGSVLLIILLYRIDYE